MRRGDTSSDAGPPMRDKAIAPSLAFTRSLAFAPSRILIYLVVALVAVAWLAPLAVVVLNSLRTNEEIAQTSMIGWPLQWAWSNYAAAWSGFCVAETCAGIRP